MTVLALVVANLAIALLVAVRGWGYYETLLIYWLEAVIIGGFNVLRLLVGASPARPASLSRWWCSRPSPTGSLT